MKWQIIRDLTLWLGMNKDKIRLISSLFQQKIF